MSETPEWLDEKGKIIEHKYCQSAAFTTTTAENKKLKKENEQLEQSLDEASQESTLKKLADAKLHRDYEDALALLDRIPKEVLAEYAHRPQPQKNEKKHNR